MCTPPLSSLLSAVLAQRQQAPNHDPKPFTPPPASLLTHLLHALCCCWCCCCQLPPGRTQVTADSWSLLHRWYGGGASITRTAVMEGLAPHSKRPRVMLYPMRLEVCWGGKPNEVKTIEAEKHVSQAGWGGGVT